MSLQTKIETKQNVLGMKVIGVDGCQSPYTGIIKELSIYDHKILGRLIQVWVEWLIKPGHLTPYEPRQFKKWENQNSIGVYYD